MNSSTAAAIPFALIIDDDPFMRLLARESLEQVGIRVVEAGDGSSGLAAVEELWPDIILLDVIMPDMDGFAVCRHLRGLTGGRHLPILMLTGLHDIDSIERAYDAGATDFITKPIVGPILGHRVRYMLNASRAMRDLAKSEAKLANAQHIAALGSWEWDIVEDRTSWSEELYRICGMEPSASEGTYEGFLHLVHPNDRKLVEAAVQEALTQVTPYSLDHRIVRPDGTERVVHGQAKVITNPGGKALLMHGTLQDITERKQAEAHIRATEHQLANILDSIDNAVWSISAATYEVLYLNPAAERIFGRSTTDFQGRKELWLEMIHPEDQDHLRIIYTTLSEDNVFALEYRIIRPDGNVRWLESRAKITHDDDGVPLHIDGIATDITDRKNQEARINHLANYDSLTSLPNRNLLNDRLGQAIVRACRTGERLAILCLDLDGFKFINDSFGHQLGDVLLQMVANRLRASVRKCDTVARLGGDEFIIILQGISIDDVVGSIARNVLGTFAQPFVIECHELHVTASIGISTFPGDGDTGDVLLKHADVAMYGAKGKGKNCYHFYMPDMSILAERRVVLESALRLAVEWQEFEIYYQPKVNLRTGRICGAEALVRWNRPGFGLVPPDSFIPLAEETGLIMPIGEWVLRSACAQAKQWHDMGHSSLTMAVNLSARQLWHQSIPELVSNILAHTGLAASHLELELTESILIKDSDSMLEVMRQLKTIGVLLTLDDFGTGYSSLSYLKRFPIDVLKIDRSFIQDVTSDENDTTLTKAIILMGHSLKMKVVAEGVETEGQLAFLNANKCDEIQGYYFSRPVPTIEFTRILEQGKCFSTSNNRDNHRDTLLILDDEPNVVCALCWQLRQDDYHILRAQTPAEAFELLALHSVQVVVSDQHMPLMTGTEFLSKVKEMYPDTVRIIISGYTELASVVEAINCGAIYRYITKPWDGRELRNNIKEAFHQHWLNHDAKSNESSRNAMR